MPDFRLQTIDGETIIVWHLTSDLLYLLNVDHHADPVRHALDHAPLRANVRVPVGRFGFFVLSVGLLGLAIVLGHNLLAHVNFPPGTALNVVWGFLFKLTFFQATPNFAILVNYPLIPWLGILHNKT
jgi:hypothetical protein